MQGDHEIRNEQSMNLAALLVQDIYTIRTQIGWDSKLVPFGYMSGIMGCGGSVALVLLHPFIPSSPLATRSWVEHCVYVFLVLYCIVTPGWHQQT
ncbi:hypothetical protein DL93DRAFT_2089579 [Clavulina sp. PMI_390]|nr:hypothetical protein DL93DRAFT_2089579 [Clavulina sp. PMI_390]